MLSQYYAPALYATKFSRAISHVSVELKTSVLQTSCLSLSIIRVNDNNNIDPDDGDGASLRNVGFNSLTRLMVREYL
jgi:hypothetical protein